MQQSAPWHRWVALGDSLTEGIGDPRPDGTVGGWVPVLEQALRTQDPDLACLNLAFRGRVTLDVTRTQQERAVAFGPDLVTCLVGGNDVLFRPATTRESLHRDITDLLAPFAGATVVVGTIPDFVEAAPWFRGTPWGARLQQRLRSLNTVVRQVAAQQGYVLVDLAAAPYRPTAWSADRLHPSREGHRLIAGSFADALGLPPVDPHPPLRLQGLVARSGRELHFMATKFFNDPDGRTLVSRIRPDRSRSAPPPAGR